LTKDVTAGNVELRAYLLSEIAYVETELGDYAAAEKRTREALSGLASGYIWPTGGTKRRKLSCAMPWPPVSAASAQANP
jgi:hypothetical protein